MASLPPTGRGARVNSFLPETYRLDKADERSEFTKIYCSDELWICKPTGANQVRGSPFR